MKTTRTIKWKGILASLLATVQAGMLFPSAGASAQTSPGGDYGQATIDGVISPDEYPESAKISLQASDFLGLKLDYSGAAEVPADLKIDLYVMWSEAGLSIGYTVEDSTPYHGAPNTFTADQLALMIDLGSSAQGGTSLKGKTLTDASSPQLGGNRAPRFNSFLDSEGTFMWLHQWVPSEGILNQVEGLSQYCAGQTIIKEEQIVGFSGEYLIPWWLLAQDMNQKTGEELFDIEEVAKGTVIGEGFEVAIMPVYYNYAVDGTGLGQYAAVTSDWFALEPDYAGVSLRLKAKATDADPTPDPDTDTDTDYDRPVIRPANGNYGTAKIDGVIEANEYPEKSTYTSSCICDNTAVRLSDSAVRITVSACAIFSIMAELSFRIGTLPVPVSKPPKIIEGSIRTKRTGRNSRNPTAAITFATVFRFCQSAAATAP